MKPFWPQRMRRLKELVDEGMSSAEIADHFGTTKQAVQRICSINKIRISRRPNLPGDPNYVPPNARHPEYDAVKPDPFGSPTTTGTAGHYRRSYYG